MKRITPEQAVTPLQKGHIRITIRYKETDYLVTYEGIFNPDRNLNPIKEILRKRAPKPANALPLPAAPVPMSPPAVVDYVAGGDS